MKSVRITDTTLRDGHQSLWATRMKIEDMLPILSEIDAAGYHSVEVWGGATFDSCLRFLAEDPWERLRIIKQHMKKTPLQMLLRGQSLVGYQHYPDDVAREFVKHSVKNGIDIIRIFDALNDVRNMIVPMQAAKEAGAHVQASVVYTVSPVHTTEHYLETAKALVDLGADSICIKDMAGLLTPMHAYDLISLLKKELNVMIQLHTHYIGGMGTIAYLKAAEAGVDVVDTASVPMAFGASQPPVELIVRVFQDFAFDPKLDLTHLFKIADYFEELRKKRGYSRGVTRISDMRVFEHQVPGGMISNLISQLEQQKALHRINEVFDEIPHVRKELGYPPLVTPTSQIVGTQAVLNVLSGKRYKLIPGEVKAYVRGQYGMPPAAIDPEIKKRIIGDEEPITVRPADLLEPGMEKAEQESKDFATSREDVLSYAMFPQVAKKFLIDRQEGTLAPAQDPIIKPAQGSTATPSPAKEDTNMNLKEIKELIKALDETDITELSLESEGVKVAIKKGSAAVPTTAVPVMATMVPATMAVAPVSQETTAPAVSAEKAVRENLEYIKAPMVGTFYRSPSPEAPSFVDLGQNVKTNQTVCIIEAMKLMNEIEAEFDCKIVEVLVENGQPVEFGQPLFAVER